MSIGKLKKRLLIFCLLASIGLHVGAVWMLYSHSFFFEGEELSAVMKPAPAPQIIPKDEDSLLAQRIEQALEESLNTVVTVSKSELHYDIAKNDPKTEEETSLIKHSVTPKKKQSRAKVKLKEKDLPIMEFSGSEFAASMPPPFDPEMDASLADFALANELDETGFTYESEILASIDFTDPRLGEVPPPSASIIEDDYTMTDTQFSPSAMPTHQTEGLTPHFVASLKKLKTEKKSESAEMSEEKMFTQLPESTTPKLVLPNSVDYLRSQWIKRSLAERKLPTLEHYGLDEIASTVEWEDEIGVEVSLMPDPDSNRYIFSLSIQPDFEIDYQSMGQNFYFLIDRSSSVEKGKFSRFKRAVLRSLAALRDGDRFNIYIFDKKIAKLSEKTLPVSPKTIQIAEDFLEKSVSKTHFAASDPYISLEKMLPQRFNPDELHSILLITDGNTLMSTKHQKRTIAGFAEKYDGNVNFYTATSGRGNNLVLLDLLAYSTGGRMLYSDTNAGFPRKLVRLVRDLHHPIVKNVTIDLTPRDNQTEVHLFPRSQLLPPMFAGKPYTLVGTIDELCDLDLFIQGKNHDRWLNIRKKISLQDATRGGRSLEKNWAHAQSKICYDHFLKNGKATHLKEAKQIVAPYKGVISMD